MSTAAAVLMRASGLPRVAVLPGLARRGEDGGGNDAHPHHFRLRPGAVLQDGRSQQFVHLVLH